MDVSEAFQLNDAAPMPSPSPPLLPQRIPTPPVFVPPPTRSGRARKFPKKFVDFLPNSATQLPHLPARPPRPIAQPRAPSPPRIIREPTPPLQPTVIRTPPNDFGLYREYTTYPSVDRDDQEDLDALCDAPGLATAPQQPKSWWKAIGIPYPTHKSGLFAPFLNATVFRLMNWYYSGSNTKSIAELDSLVKNVILADDFSPAHLKNFSAARELRRLDSDDPEKSPFAAKDGWKTSTVRISLPAEGVSHESEGVAPTLDVPNIYHRSLVSTIISALQDESAKLFHFIPFRLFWKPTPNAIPERVLTELYNSDAFIAEHEKISKIPPPLGPGPTMENAIAAMMLWSDSTHLANFGDASLWPIYLFLGNQSKYTRAKPNSCAAHHVAYIPEVLFFSCQISLVITQGIHTATKESTRPVHESFWRSCCISQYDYAPQTRAHAGHLVVDARSRVHACIRTRYRHGLRRWNYKAYFPSILHVFSRLPGEVSIYYFI